jgi:hypothetical protein
MKRFSVGFSTRSAAFALLLTAMLTACERTKTVAPDATPAGVAAPIVPTLPTSSTRVAWDNALGTIIATPSLDSGLPVIFVRDSTAQGDVSVELFSHDVRTVTATVHLGASTRACALMRSGSVATADAPKAPLVWSLALSPGFAEPLSVDGIGDLSPRDSSALAVRLRKIIGTLPDDSASASFRGLPVVLRDAWRVDLVDGTAIAVGLATRSTNVESNPRAQLTVLIAESDSTGGAGSWRLGFSRRDDGPEDRAEGTDLLAALILKNGHPALAFVRDGDHGMQIEIVERMAPAVWKLRWSSASVDCGT